MSFRTAPPDGFRPSTEPAKARAPPSVTLSTPAGLPGRDRPVAGTYDAAHLVAGGGVAIFHVATARVVLCWHTGHRFWFLPKGRRDPGESAVRGAEREGFEESGYRNRVLPIPIRHTQPPPSTHSFEPGGEQRAAPPHRAGLATEPVLTQIMPVGRSKQYLLHWFVAETLPPDTEAEMDRLSAELARKHTLEPRRVYLQPPPWPEGLALRDRVKMDCDGRDGQVHEPVWHEGTGVDEDEEQFESYLVPVDEAVELLHYDMDYVVRAGWTGIQRLWEMEAQDEPENK